MNIGDSVTVVVPHRISGFFQIVESGGGIPVDDIAKVGSRGGGPSLTAYGKTNIMITDILGDDESSECKIFINGENCTNSAKTTYYVFSNITSLLEQPVKIKIEHQFDMPIGAGFGASGCGAIGTAFGLNYLLDVGLSYNNAGKIAHIGEVMNKTGLGTVGGQLHGGLSLSIQPGFPFMMDKIIVPPNLNIVCTSFGPIPTESIIGESEFKNRIKQAGAWAMKEVLAKPIFQKFIDVSRQFVEKTGILNAEGMEKTHELIVELNKLPIYGASMNQLGKSVYSFCNNQDLIKVKEICESFSPKFLQTVHICHHGPLIEQ